MPRSSQPSAPRDPALDGLRGVAVLLVFFFHYGGGLRARNPVVHALGWFAQAGWMGVEVFFALSGFLITGLLLQDRGTPHALRNFYARRALRILPLYFAALLACGLAALLTGASLAQLQPLWVYAVFLQNLPPLLPTALHTPAPLPVFHLWSVAVEEQFYLLWPFVLLLAARTPRRGLQLSLSLFALSCVFRIVLFAPGLLPYATAETFAAFLPVRLGALALGSALAQYRQLQAIRPNSSAPSVPSLVVLAIGLGLMLLTALHTHNFLLNNRPAFVFMLPGADLLAAALVALSLQPGRLRRILSSAALAFVGRLSFGFYVLHVLLEPLFDRLGTLLTQTHAGFGYQTARLLSALPLTLAGAWLSFALLERPFLRLKRRFPHRGTA